MHRLLFRVNVGVYNKHRRLRSGVHSVGRQKLSDAIRLDVSKHFIPFDGNNPHDVDSYHGKTRATMWILTTKGYGMMLPSRLHWATSRRLGADILHGHEMEIARLEPDEIARNICGMTEM